MFSILNGSILSSLYDSFQDDNLGEMKYLTFMLYKDLFSKNERMVVDWGGTS